MRNPVVSPPARPAWIVLSVVVLASAPAVRAEDGFEAEPFRPAPDPAANLIDVAAPAARPAGAWSLAAIVDHAEAAVRLEERASGELPYAPRGLLVARPTVLHLLGSYAFTGRIALGADVPVVVHQTGDGELGLADPAPLEGTGVGDVRVIPKLVALDAAAGPGRFGVALLPEVALPTGDRAQFHGGGARFSPRLAAGWGTDDLRLVANGGYSWRDEVRLLGLEVKDGFTWGVGAEVPLHRSLRVLATATHELATEGTLGAGVRIGGVEALAGAAVGLVDDALTPEWRAFGGLAVALGGGEAAAVRMDADGDGLADGDDACPRTAEDLDRFEDDDGCPDEDDDGDGLADADDRCPRDGEDVDGFADLDGCPDPDGDADGVTDAFDRCPEEAEDRDGYVDGDGCADPDNDGDRIADAADRCPIDPEDPDGTLDGDGCPDVEPAVAIDVVVLFPSGSARLPVEAIYPLERVARTILAFPDRLRVFVEGHADELGADEDNLALSGRRARAVAAFLESRGVPRDRLVTRAHGEWDPAVVDDRELARTVNRRVEFRVAPLGIPEAPAETATNETE